MDLHDRLHQNLTIAAKFQWLEKTIPSRIAAVVIGLGLDVRFCADGFEFTALGGNKTHECAANAAAEPSRAAERKTKMTMAGNKFLQFPTALQLPAAIFSGRAHP